MSYYVFVDNSDVWIEGKYVSAVKKGYAKDVYEAHNNNTKDNGWAIDFGKMLSLAANNEPGKIRKSYLFGSRPTDKDSLWGAARRGGFEVITEPRNVANSEKKVDTGIVAKILETLYTQADEGDEFVLFMGDGDFVPVMEQIHNKRVKVKVVFWSHASAELIKESDEFIDLNSKIDEITYK